MEFTCVVWFLRICWNKVVWLRLRRRIRRKLRFYNPIDESSGFFRCPVEKYVRSLMNVPFTLGKSELEREFIREASKENMVQL
jgi:phosphoserine aminotransferase